MSSITSQSDTTNTFYLKLPMGASLRYTPNSFFDGQGNTPTPAISTQASDGTFTITVDEDRHGSQAVSDAFVNACTGDKHIFCATTDTPRPDNGNFYFGLDIAFLSVPITAISCSVTVYVAQCNEDTSNRWWIGCSQLSPPTDTSNIASIAIQNLVPCTFIAAANFQCTRFDSGSYRYQIYFNNYTPFS